jgi:pyridoxamine 5'-phosphate oxidase family protein
MFTEKEIAYLTSQRLTRFATTAPDGQPDVAPVGFEFDGEAFYIGGYDLSTTRKYKNVQAGQAQVALVVDDLVSVNPWQPRGIRVYGRAEVVEHEGYAGRGDYLRITPQVSWSWNIETPKIFKTVHVTDQAAEERGRS